MDRLDDSLLALTDAPCMVDVVTRTDYRAHATRTLISCDHGSYRGEVHHQGDPGLSLVWATQAARLEWQAAHADN